MEFGIMGVAGIEPDPDTGYTPTGHERIQGVVESASRAEKLGFDVFAFGEHHNPPFAASSPVALLSYLAVWPPVDRPPRKTQE